MPLSRPINDAHPTAPDFLQNLIIPYSPNSIARIELAEHVIKRFIWLRLVSVAVDSFDKETVETKTATNAQWRSTLLANAQLILVIEGNRTVQQAHGKGAGKVQPLRIKNRKLRPLLRDIPRAFG